ncbi:MAG: membrane protein insertion efficiency factor YidD [Candidatus Korobacteraceae bacterium]|jgi:putative membrane protein insertion efficiency factor
MRWLAVQLICFYKRWLSPALPVSCRFQPTCSEYAMEAVDRHGILCGALLALARVARCNPLGGSGYDPVRRDLGFKIFDFRLKVHGGHCLGGVRTKTTQSEI